MELSLPAKRPVTTMRTSLIRRYREYRLIAQDPVLFIGLLASGIFLLTFVIWPLARVAYQSLFTLQGQFSLEFFRRYLDVSFGPQYRQVFVWTVEMGIFTAIGSTVLGFLFAYTVVRCNVPFKGLIHALILLPTISPPFAIAIATILLFGRNGLVTKQILHIEFGPGVNDVYGLDGLVFVQIITFFSISYLIIRGMLERIDPSMEEAALSLGASKLHIFRTITLPLLTPGIAGSFLLMFVESLADLGNPVFIGGNVTVLSTQIWMAVIGEYDQQKGAALSMVLLIPTLTVFLLQRYWVSRKSYISVTGKPTGGGAGFVKEPFIRWTFIALSLSVLILILALYAAILTGSMTKLWGIDYTLDLRHYGAVFDRGLEAILDTTFLSALATPIAGVAGMVIAFLVVRKAFSGKGTLDFISTLGGAVPGTILGIGYIMAFIKAPTAIVVIIYLALASYLASTWTGSRAKQASLLLLATLGGLAIAWLSMDNKGRAPWADVGLLSPLIGAPTLAFRDWLAVVAAIYLVAGGLGLILAEHKSRRTLFVLLILMAAYLLSREGITVLTGPFTLWGRGLGGFFWPRVVTSVAAWINLFFQPPLAMVGFTYTAISAYIALHWNPRFRAWAVLGLLAASSALVFYGEPLALVGSPYIVLGAYAVRSLPASVRAGIASLQQIDPAIEEASTSLGADASLTFRRITLPLILPAFVAGLIFSFARHMTSLSAIIFLSTPKWPILTALIMSEVEQGVINLAAAYSMVLIFIVLGAIGLLYFWAGRAFRTEGIELTLGAG